MKIEKLRQNNENNLIKQCVKTIQSGGVVLLPTETVYGLTCNWSNNQAKEKLYQLKGRDKNKPFQMLIHDADLIYQFKIKKSELLDKLCQTFCPGPITIVAPTINSNEKIGFRIPNHPFVLSLLKQLSSPLAATSANAAGEPLCLTPQAAIKQLSGEPSLIIDAGEISENSLASTVVEVVDNKFSILREGIITKKDIENIIQK